jgi:hypothetical protein
MVIQPPTTSSKNHLSSSYEKKKMEIGQLNCQVHISLSKVCSIKYST